MLSLICCTLSGFPKLTWRSNNLIVFNTTNWPPERRATHNHISSHNPPFSHSHFVERERGFQLTGKQKTDLIRLIYHHTLLLVHSTILNLQIEYRSKKVMYTFILMKSVLVISANTTYSKVKQIRQNVKTKTRFLILSI